MKSLLVVYAGPDAVRIDKHLGTNMDVLVLAWSPKTYSGNWSRHNDYDPSHRKFMAVGSMPFARDFSKQYKSIILADDDVTPETSWSEIASEGWRQGYDIWHPALTWDSHTAHPYMYREPNVLCRTVNWIDLQAVCFSAAAFDRWLPDFYASGPFSWGLLECWAAKEKVGLIDCAPIHHPAGKLSSGAWKGIGCRCAAIQQKVAFEQAHGLPGKAEDGGYYEVRETRWLTDHA